MCSVKGYPVSGGGAFKDKASAYQLLRSESDVSISANATLVDSDGVDGASAGDIIEYAIVLKNTGTTTLRNFTVSDELLDEQLQRWEYNQLLSAKAVMLMVLRRAATLPSYVGRETIETNRPRHVDQLRFVAF